MKSQDLRNKIIRHLSTNEFLSGEELGERLGVTRAAISKQVKSLQALGLDIYSVTGKGHKLAQSIELMNLDRISSNLDNTNQDLLCIDHVVDSTNDVVKAKSASRNGFVCVAEAQTKGRGRHGRKWYSPFGSNIYLSMTWCFPDGFQAMAGLSLCVAVQIVNAIKSVGIENAKVKWPNDILIEDKKLAGTLIEAEGQTDGSTVAIIGVGVNFDMSGQTPDIDQDWTDLKTWSSESLSRNTFSAALINELRKGMELFELQGLEAFQEQWQNANAHANTPVKLFSGQNTFEGIHRGINGAGALLLEMTDNLGKKTVKPFYGGEISVRKTN